MAENLADIMEVGDDIEASDKVEGFKATHKDVVGYWTTQIKAAEEKAKPNREDAKEAEKFYRGDPTAWEDDATWTGPTTQENIFYRDVMVMSGQLLYTDPKTVASTNRSKQYKGFAKATQNFNNYVIKEQQYKAEIKRSLIQAIFRNFACVHHYWDPHRQLPEIQWIANEVYPDVDCQGDLRRADWVVVEFFPTLDEMLADPEISDQVKKKLAEHPQAYRYPNKGGDEAEAETGTTEAAEESAPEVDTKADPSRIKLRAFKVYTKKGIAPNLKAKALLKKAKAFGRDDDDAEEEVSDIKDVDGKDGKKTAKTFDITDRLGYGIPENPTPEDQEEYNESIEEGLKERLCVVVVENFPLVLKATPWPLDFFDADEWPISMLRLTELPGDIYGVSLFKVLRPLLKVINFILSFWFADVRESCRRDLFVDEDAFADTGDEGGGIAKLGSGVHNQAIKTKKGRAKDAVHIQEYTPRQDGPIARLLEIARRGHDDTSGVNDMARGSTGDVEKTKAEAMLLNDRASEAIGIIVDAVDDFIRDIARKTTMCLHTYVERESKYKPCKECKGTGIVKGTELEQQSLAGSDEVPCKKCGGKGNSDVVIYKGADYFLSEDDAKNWIDDLSIDRIRAEITIDVEPGSTRRTNQERKLYQLLQLFNTVGPVLEKHGCWRAFGEMVRRIIMNTEVPDAESMAPTPEEWDAAVAVAEQMRQMAAQPPPPPPPPPDPAKVAQINANAMLEKARMDAAIEMKRMEMERDVKLLELEIKQEELKIKKQEAQDRALLGIANAGMKGANDGAKNEQAKGKLDLESGKAQRDGDRADRQEAREIQGENDFQKQIEMLMDGLDQIKDRLDGEDIFGSPAEAAAGDALRGSEFAPVDEGPEEPAQPAQAPAPQMQQAAMPPQPGGMM